MPNNFLKNDANQSSNEMKSVLLQMSEELASKTDQKSQELAKQVEKMLVQIDYHQLLSLTANSNYVYVPFFWDMLEDGTINMKKVDEEKFYCQINLTLKDFGKVDLMLSLYDKNKLDLSIYAQREHFKIAVKENLQKLKKALNSVELIPVNIKLLNLEEDKTEETKKTEVYVNPYNDDLDSGLNIRV
ncbi:flagellar hook-length control protein FliK [Poseidonibacter sp.]|uniref:flagellar hook-length control protein FliK n=1 Tax=Poseidonibacter sp. TaxID=2321188 RepID=UPI003C73AE56